MGLGTFGTTDWEGSQASFKTVSVMGIYVSTYQKYLDGLYLSIKVQLDEEMFTWGRDLRSQDKAGT